MTLANAVFRSTILSLLLAGILMVISVPTHAQLATAPRLAAFENTTLEGQRVPFVIEEMQVGDIRHIVDYLLLHGRYNLEQGNGPLASAQLQWAASLMDLNAGLSDTPEQDAVRRAASGISALAEGTEPSEPRAPSKSTLKTFFKAHHALARYHQRRAAKLLNATKPVRSENAELVRQNAIFQKKAGRALSAALTHFDRAKTTLAQMHQQPLESTHYDDVTRTYGVVEALKVASGQVDSEKAHSAVNELDQAISALSRE